MLTHHSSHIIEANGSTEIQIFPVKEKIMYIHKNSDSSFGFSR